MDYLIGTVIGNRYEIIEKVGTGGMATVYKAKCKVLDRFVAIKILKDSLKNDIEVVKKFNTESRAAARLSHPNIVQVYDVSESGELDYIVMEYVDGMTLKEYITKKGHLDPKEACEFAAQIGRALVCAHANGIIHRDIKPHNVLMASDGTVKVADFGIAQATTSETLVAGSGAMGSVHYISPEQARGGFTNERSDIYSLGVVLYEMLSGKVPFDGANPVAVALAKLENDPEDIREKCEYSVPDRVCNIVMKAISKDQHSRYQSAAEMVNDLEVVVGTSILAKTAMDRRFETKRLNDQKAKEEYNMRKNTGTQNRRKKKNNKNTGLIIAIAAMTITVCLGLWGLLSIGGSDKEYTVPDLSGLTVEEAKDLLKEHGLDKYGIAINDNIREGMSDKFEVGQIMSQNPAANQKVKKNRKITVTVVSLDAEGELIPIPNVVDLKLEDAQKRLEAAGFICDVEREDSSTVEPGRIIRQYPTADEKIERGSEIILYVSQEAKISVPKVTGHTQADAVKMIEDAGLSVGDITKGESDEPAGTVISQTPGENETVERGTKVDIVLSAEKPAKRKTLTITIPSEGEEKAHIIAIADGKEVYNKTHDRSEGIVDIPVQSKKTEVRVQVYIDGEAAADKVIYFD